MRLLFIRVRIVKLARSPHTSGSRPVWHRHSQLSMQLPAVGMKLCALQVATANCSRRLARLPWKELPVRMSSFMLLIFA